MQQIALSLAIALVGAAHLTVGSTTSAAAVPRPASCNVEQLRTRISEARERPVAGQRAIEIEVLERLYADVSKCPLWSYQGLPTIPALSLIDQFVLSESQGLRPADYNVANLEALAWAMASRSNDSRDIEAFDMQLSRALVRYLVHLNIGRVDPHKLNVHLTVVPGRLNFDDVIGRLRASHNVRAILATVEPPYAGYAALKGVLAKYRSMAGDVEIPEWTRTRVIKPFDTSAALPILRRRLVALGDLSTNARLHDDTAATDTYSGPLVDAVKHFQMRHGLAEDGVLGATTQAALQVPIRERVRQMELTLERWRWLPDRAPSRYVVVNVPAFRLYAFENDPVAALPKVSMSVIVGRAQGRRTPLFTEVMREVVFRPYWDVPINIARNELIPAIRRRPGYMDREALEIVKGDDRRAVVYAPTPENLAKVAAGTLRIRQRPGNNNALGSVKFVFPNPYNVYMHGTPAQLLFASIRRDFSHGCIRLEDPPALLAFVLSGQPGWDSTSMQAALHGPLARHVKLERPVTVFILYGTTAVGPSGELRVYSDIYGHDAALTKALDAFPTW